MRRRFGHLPQNALIQLLRAARASPEYIEAARRHRCEACDVSKDKPQTEKVAMPKPYVFNYEAGFDVLEVADVMGNKYSLLNVVCLSLIHI